MRDNEISRIQGIDDKTSRLENRLSEFENEKDKIGSEITSINERDEFNKKNINKLFSQYDQIDEKLETISSGILP